MYCGFECYTKLSLWRTSSSGYQPETQNSNLHMVILGHYMSYLSKMSEEELPQILQSEADWMDFTTSRKEISISSVHEHKRYIFKVPTLKNLPQHATINKFRPVKEFLSFLAQMLYHKPGSIIDSCVDQIKNVEKELRFLLAVLGDTSLMVCASENVLAEFEGVANEAGSFVHSLFFLTRQSIGGRDDEISLLLDHINLLKANIINLSARTSRSTNVSLNTSVVDSLLVLDILVRDLEDIMNRDGDPIADVEDQIQTLHQGLLCLQSFIKETGFPQPSEIVELKECCLRIGDLSHEAQHLIVSFLGGDAPPWYLVNRFIHLNRDIDLCRIELHEIRMRYTSGGLKVAKYLKKQLSSSLAKRNTEVDDDVVGFEDNMAYILDQLVGGGEELRVISIFGMPGLGKTTFANKLYNHPLVNYRYDKLSWCVVSQTYLMHNVLSNILIHISSEVEKDRILKMEEESLVEHIYKALKGRRFLIVMDDIWDSKVWDELQRCFPNDGNGSRILFTTRNNDVAPPNCIMYAMPSLSDEQCWEILQKKVFNNQPCPPQLVERGREFAASCQGMPLAAVVMGGVLSTVEKEERAWEEVKSNLSSYMLDGGDNPVMQILKLSYNHLPQHLKPCFLYVGVFLEDREIRVRDMMNLWISEGFIPFENEKDVEDVAEDYLMELIHKSLVMVDTRRSDGGPKFCLVHDLLRELCLKTCEEEKLTRFVNIRYYKNVEDVQSVVNTSTAWMCCQHMRHRFGKRFGKPHHRRRRRTAQVQLHVPDMRLLRVLYFDCSFIYLSGIEYLVCLKYLVVRDLSPLISNLVNLEYLCVLSKRVYLPSTIMKMKKLKSVDSPYGVIYGKDCNTSLTNKLEFISFVWIREVKDEGMLKCSPHLRRLGCYYKRKVHRLIDLSFLTRLNSLHLLFKKHLFIEEIRLPSSIKKLTLRSINYKVCMKTISMIGRLENLEILELFNIEFEGDRWDTRDGEFQKLKFLKMWGTTKLRHWNVESSQHFPQLQKLVLSGCWYLQEIPYEIGEIPTMQMIEVNPVLCRESLVESATRIQQEQRDMGNEDLKVIILKDHSLAGFICF